MTAKRIATFKNPDVDSLTATWLGQRFLHPADPVEVVFVPESCRPEQLADFDWVVEAGAPDLLGFDWGAQTPDLRGAVRDFPHGAHLGTHTSRRRAALWRPARPRE
jgi:hypothetical protein